MSAASIQASIATGTPSKWSTVLAPQVISGLAEPLSQVDWIGGFTGDRCDALEVFLQPLVRCIGREDNSSGVVARVARSRQLLEKRSERIFNIGRIVPGNVMASDLRGRFAPRPMWADVLDKRPHAVPCEFDITTSSATSTCLPFLQMPREQPEIAEVISSWSECPDSVSFYIAEDHDVTVVIPTALIFSICYEPGAVYQYLSKLGDLERSIRVGSLVKRDIGAHSGIVRHEMSQIAARAHAYYQTHGRFVPLLIRPPFEGLTRIVGTAVVSYVGLRPIFLFTALQSMHSTQAASFESAAGETLTPREQFRVELNAVTPDWRFMGTAFDFCSCLLSSSTCRDTAHISLRPEARIPSRSVAVWKAQRALSSRGICSGSVLSTLALTPKLREIAVVEEPDLRAALTRHKNKRIALISLLGYCPVGDPALDPTSFCGVSLIAIESELHRVAEFALEQYFIADVLIFCGDAADPRAAACAMSIWDTLGILSCSLPADCGIDAHIFDRLTSALHSKTSEAAVNRDFEDLKEYQLFLEVLDLMEGAHEYLVRVAT